MPKVNEVHQNAALSNVSIGYKPTGFVAEEVLPVLNVKKESDKYYIWDKDMGLRYQDSQRADGAKSKTISFKVSTGTYSCEEYALKVRITDRERANADDVLQLETSKTERVTGAVRLGQEVRVATLLTTAANYPSSNKTQLSGTSQWSSSSLATGAIESDIDTGKEAVRKGTGGFDPTHIIVPAAVSKIVKRNASIRELIKYTQNNLLVNGDLPPTMFNMVVVIPKTVYTVSVEGNATQTYTDVWGKHCVLVYNPGSGAAIDTPSFGYIFRAKNWEVMDWYDPEYKSTFIEVSVIQDEVITSNVSGYLIEDAIA